MSIPDYDFTNGTVVTWPPSAKMKLKLYKPRKQRKPKEFPVLTSGLETKLMNCIGENADKVIAYLTNKIDEPTIFKGLDSDHYEFHNRLTTRKQLPFNPTNMFDQSNIFDTFHSPTIETKTVEIIVRLHVLANGTLTRFHFQLGGF